MITVYQNVVSLLILVVLFSSAIFNVTAASGPQMPARQAMSVYFNDSARKIPPAGIISSDPWIWDGKKVQLSAARGEREAFIFTVDAHVDLDALRVSFSGFSGDFGDIEAKHTCIKTLFYVRVRAPSGHLGRPGIWPDALLPHRRPFTLDKGKRKSFWINTRIPEGTSPGLYQGTLEIAGLLFSHTIPVELNVSDITLDKGTSLKTRVCQDLHVLKRFHPEWREDEIQFSEGRFVVSGRVSDIISRYDDFLAEYRLSPGATFFFGKPPFRWERETPRLNFGGVDVIYRFYLEESGLSTFGLPFNYMNLFEHDPLLQYGSQRFTSRARAYLATLVRFFEENGWLDKNLVYIQGSDFAGVEGISGEPHHIGPAAYNELQRWADIITSVSTSLNFYVIAPPYYPEPLPDLRHAIGAVGWTIDNIDNDPETQFMLGRRGIITMAVPGIYSDAIDIDGFYHRALGFFCHKYNLTGFDQWQTFAWGTLGPGGAGMNPWQAVDFSGSLGAGAGCLIYPGIGSVRGPVSTLRLEMMRKAVEDYELIRAVSGRGEQYAGYVDQVVKRVLPGKMREIIPDPARIHEARKVLFDLYDLDTEFEEISGRVRSAQKDNTILSGRIITEYSAVRISEDGSFSILLPDFESRYARIEAEGHLGQYFELTDGAVHILQPQETDVAKLFDAETGWRQTGHNQELLNENEIVDKQKSSFVDIRPGMSWKAPELSVRNWEDWDRLLIDFHNPGAWPVKVVVIVQDIEGRMLELPLSHGFIAAARWAMPGREGSRSDSTAIVYPLELLRQHRYELDDSVLGPVRRPPLDINNIETFHVHINFGGGKMKFLGARLERDR